jgi:cysteine-rich repeat protein
VTDLATEECDDGNQVDTDGCDGQCMIVNPDPDSCGNGLLEAGNNEQCDDSNGANGDGCSATCQFETVGASCGDGNVDAGEVCDDGSHCGDGTQCSMHSDCTGIGDDQCLPRNGDGCNTTCNFGNSVETYHLYAPVAALAADNTYLWAGLEGAGMERIDVGTCNPTCMDGAGANADTCSVPCATEVILTNAFGVGSLASDGTTLWFSDGANSIVALDIATCNATLSGSGDCDTDAVLVAGGGAGAHSDGVGAGAGISGIRGLTYYGGQLYFSDGDCGTLRVYDPSDDSVTTLVGPATLDPSTECGNQTATEGQGAAARMSSPRYIASDNSGYIYVSDNFEHGIWRYDTRSTDLVWWAGTRATQGYVDAASGTNAQFARPRDIISDGTSLFVADYLNHAIRQIDLVTTGTTTLVGNGTCGTNWGVGTQAGISKPMTLAYHFPSASLFFYQNAFQCTATTQIMRIR